MDAVKREQLLEQLTATKDSLQEAHEHVEGAAQLSEGTTAGIILQALAAQLEGLTNFLNAAQGQVPPADAAPAPTEPGEAPDDEPTQP